MQLTSPFLFTLCQLGAETALKDEISRASPPLRFAFSRPGFVTFKSSHGALSPNIELDLIFARAYGMSLGKSSLLGTPLSQIAETACEQFGKSKLRLHVYERDQYPAGKSPKGFQSGEWLQKAKAQILDKSLFFDEEKAESGDLILDLIAIEENEFWMGLHIHSASHSPYPGGNWPFDMPPDSPSRAYLKLEEVLEWSHLPLKAGDTAVELGSAPGGSCYALLNRSLNVVGIDPGKMDALFHREPHFKQIQKEVAGVLREDLPSRVDWLLSDMNIAPRFSLFAVDRLASRMTDSLLGMILTLKLNQWNLAREIPSMVEHAKAMGLKQVKVAQLSTHGQEVALAGLTTKGLRRQKALRRS